mmetsp:Transcript_10565/g.23398  ORF Transcript_10565/g.23398 Transcript_10565/m.23398 type:complete len:188 (-) Transcript_10565:251-814(-)|eukprot:CAMPEP_0172321862 /NCGR_PEP_ID=MMETSP1058-20130122/44486_1 /TAXON_ID=83371 /ORGANISM="Detonula confervacea, Strain CCMP 353" /LENGTH=187 /DNA_ID=CAMNT_0013037471 /DNA_START=139 /DNA_END=702 /DNA_ORIENTATION=+
MNPIQYFVTLLTCAVVSGHSTRGGQARRRALKRDDATEPSPFGSSMSFRYEDPSTTEDKPLNGTSWTALNIGPSEEFTEPITLSFDSVRNRISGSTGCNRYRGEFDILPDDALSINNAFSTTKMFCKEEMEQERNFVSFLENETFFYDIISTDGSNDELVLFNYVTGTEGESVRGDILARFEEDTPS